MRRFAIWFTLCLVFPLFALAAPDTPYAPDTVLLVEPLTPEAIALLDVIYPAIRRCEPSIELPRHTLYDDANAAMQCLSRNYPELFHLERTWGISYYQSEPQYAAGISFSYIMSADTYERTLSELMACVQSLTGSAAGSQTERAEYLHDALCLRATYDYSENAQMNNHAAGALLTGSTLCEGYSQGLALLYRMSGIPCGVVTGTSIDEEGVARHAWNIAAIDGAATLIDATWNDQDDDHGITYWYYGLTTDMMGVNHIPDPELSVPRCDATQANWHVRHGLFLTSREDVMRALGVFARDDEVSVRFASRALYADFLSQTNQWIGDYNAACPSGDEFYGAYSFISDPDQLCVKLWCTGRDGFQ